MTTQEILEATEGLDFLTSSHFVRAYPISREWLMLLYRQRD